MALPKTSGIYTITNTINGKMYVGYALNIQQRCKVHKRHLRKNKHVNPHLQNSYNEYGGENFNFEELEEYPEDLLVAMEHYWATILRVHEEELGYNIKPTHPYKMSTRHKQETIEKIRFAHIGKKETSEQIEAKRQRNLGKKLSEEHKKKLGDFHRGRKRSKETCKSISESLKKTVKITLMFRNGKERIHIIKGVKKACKFLKKHDDYIGRFVGENKKHKKYKIEYV